MSAPTNSYNRPNAPHVCGRARLWQKPCQMGPKPDGSCGGTSSCMPQKQGDRWRCRRSDALGGPCTEGPLPDGTCTHTRPPCSPGPSLRARRQRLTTAAAFLAIGILFAFGMAGGIGVDDGYASRDPGPLRAAHTSVMDDKGCKSCHAPHGEDATGFLLAAFSNTAPDAVANNKCLDCHVFDTLNTPHKANTCASCHSEHQGHDMPVSSMTDNQCNACHKKKVSSFSNDHPPFAKAYPHDRRTTINFDHTKHLDDYFKDQRYAENAPEGSCISCHDVSQASRAVPVRSFDQVCANCHVDQIPRRDLVLFEMPELAHNPIDTEELIDVCRANPELTQESEFYSVSTEIPNKLATLLFEMDANDIEGYTPAIGDILLQAIEDGPTAFETAIKDWDGNPARLLAGLSREVIRQASCAWAFNSEYDAPAPPDHGGWYADELSLRYKATSHGDPVMKAWLSFIAQLEEDDLTETLLTKDGPGACLACHAVSQADFLNVEWSPAPRPETANFSYDHGPHINLLGPGSQCETCHSLDKTINYGANFTSYDPTVYASGFKSMTLATCKECHGETKLASGCQTCHSYHGESGFKSRQFSEAAGDVNKKQGE